MEDRGYRMRTKKIIYRILTIILLAAQAAGLCPAGAFANEDAPGQTSATEAKKDQIQADSILPLSGIASDTEAPFTISEEPDVTVFSNGNVRYALGGNRYSEKDASLNSIKDQSVSLDELRIDLNNPSQSIDRYKTASGNVTFDGNTYPMKIRGRGNTSWWYFPQKAYLLNLEDPVSILGWTPAEKYALIPCYIDRSFIRNPVSMDMSRVLDNLDYTPKQVPVNVYINGDYRGIYILSEHIDMGPDKVDLFPKGPVLSGEEPVSDNMVSKYDEVPFFLECGGDLRVPHTYAKDYYQAAHTPQLFLHYPEPEKQNSEEFTYVKDYIDATDKAIVAGEGYDQYIDVDSFVDWFIIMEMTCNTDSALWRSTFMYKPFGEKLKLCPVWDFDRAYGNFSYDNTSYAYWASAEQVYDRAQGHWMSYLYKSDDFMLKVQKRWDEKKIDLMEAAYSSISRNRALVESSRALNDRRWGTYSNVNSADTVKRFIEKRYNWIDTSIHMEDFNRHAPAYTVSDTPMPSDDIMAPVDPALIQQLLQDPNTAAALAAGQPTEFNSMYHIKIHSDIADHISGLHSEVSSTISADTTDAASEENSADEIYTVSDNMTVKVSKFDRKEYEDIEKAINLHLFEGSLVCSCSDNEVNIEDCINVEDNVITIKQGGIYVISGTMRKGSIKVDGPDNKKVRIILDNAFIASDFSAPLDIEKADKASVIAKDDTKNYLIKTGEYTYENKSEKPTACLFARCDLTLGGIGSLTVKTECGNGIGTKDDLKIMNGNIYVQSVKNGLKGNDSVSIFGGTIRVRAGKDAVKSDKEDKEGKGFIFINNGNMAFIAGDDILESPSALVVRGGQMNNYFGGKEFNCNGYTEVTKADQ